MAGSFKDTVTPDGGWADPFTTAGDRRDAMRQAHQIIAELVRNQQAPLSVVATACHRLGYSQPTVAPVIVEELTGPGSVYRPDSPADRMIWSRVESQWLMPDGATYTSDIMAGGRFTRDMALSIVATLNASGPNAIVCRVPEGM
jgi:hypothetical protein